MSNRKKPAATFRKAGGVVLATVNTEQVSTFFHQSMLKLALADAMGPKRIVNILTEYSSANISHARNTLVKKFLAAPDGDWLLFLDSDMIFEPDIIEGLLANASPDKAPIVGALCFGVNDGNLFPTLYNLAQTDDGRVVTVRHQGPIPEATMVQVAATGAAALLIHRSVLLRIADRAYNPTFPWFQETELGGQPCGEDFTFCLRAGQLDIPVYVFTAVEVGHHKGHNLTHDLYKSQRSSSGDSDAG